MATKLNGAITLGILPREIIRYLIQPDSVAWEIGLSSAVQQAIPAICQRIKNELVDSQVEALD